MNDIEKYLEQENERIHNELYDFLRIPSVSAEKKYDADTRRAAEWVKVQMEQAGLVASVRETGGHPAAVGEWRGAADAPTVLVYGHYDVQPAEPLELWTTPAFEPTLRDGKIFARGSVDDKGQLFMHIKAIEAHLKVRGTLPINIVMLAEGEEEVGSENLAKFIEDNKAELKCDAVVISDSGMFAPGIPSILSSLRGLSYFQIDVVGANTDLHSGSYGGAVANPATALGKILASFHDDKGKVLIEGFYDDVLEWPKEVIEQMRALPFDAKAYEDELGVPLVGGEQGYTPLERVWTRPTCEVNGLLSGYTGEGAKTVLPNKAMAKVSCRLVPGQDPHKIESLFKAHVARVAPPGVKVEVSVFSGGHPWRAELNGPIFTAAKAALANTFGREPVITGEGGSIPVVSDFENILKAPVLLVGFGLPGENAHAPNEWLSDQNFVVGMRALAQLWDEYAKAVK
ncbi:MAG TPA: dipeptidase [Candidatus Paceibacterota bacterium]|jgi:acetylornithine deacetylase/succinyl-diaminopimelate desuccinylase-like protein|nr:dipeptidase [Candidatus Paceibacterota bacterium]